MNIGIDIDGTVSTPYCWRKLFNKIFDKNLKEEDCVDYNVSLLYDNKDLWSIVFNQYKQEFFDSVDIREDALPVLRLLKKRHNCCFITARTNEGYIKERATSELMLKNCINNKTIRCGQGDSFLNCRRNNKTNLLLMEAV